MREKKTLSGILALLMADMVGAAPIVIGGSSTVAPPPFWASSFWGMTPYIDRAFPFTVPDGGPFLVEEVQVALYHYSNLAGDQAIFGIAEDNVGNPGSSLMMFTVTGIPTTAQIMSATAQENVTVQSGSTYWLVGSTPYGQVNWNLGDMAFGKAAYRVDSGMWTILSYANISAFAVLGSPVPEPGSLLLLAPGVLSLLYRRRGPGGHWPASP